MDPISSGERPHPNPPPEGEGAEEAVERIASEGPKGTWAVAGLATFLVVLIYVLFYFLAYLPRGAVQ
ncbi:MAG TPA: hypothetical protein VF522_20070 [Ramlibacter sp.]|uniref:hypothetical protein n=1 Tax=Ramlibacter sp. TaxID=1917967 RepID=UPI002ED36D91